MASTYSFICQIFCLAVFLLPPSGANPLVSVELTEPGDFPGFRENVLYLDDAVPRYVLKCSVGKKHAVVGWKLVNGQDCNTDPTVICAELVDEGEATITITTGRFHAQGANYTCAVKRGTKHTAAYQPVTVSVYRKDKSIQVSDDLAPSFNESQVELNCSTNSIVLTPGSSVATAIWYKNGKELNTGSAKRVSVDSTGELISIDHPQPGDSGIYMCVQAITTANKVLLKRNWIVITGKPDIIGPETKSKNMMEGDSVTLTCDAVGQPAPEIAWKRVKDEEAASVKRISEDDDRYSIGTFQGLPGGKLSITDLKFDDRAHYVCTATNQLGAANFTVNLRVKDKLAALWPFLGIVLEVVILVSVIFLYERYQKRKQEREDEAEDIAEQKQALTPNQEIRNRKI
jgi:basigin